jgi:dipeptidase E
MNAGGSADEQSADEETTDEQSAGGASAGGASADGASADGASAGGTSADGASADGASAGGASADGASAGGASADGASAGGASAGEATAGGANAGEQIPAPVPHAERRIFAMGGGGFTMEPTNPLLDDFVLSLARAARPRVLFLPTAAGDTTGPINAFYARFAGRGCRPEHLSLFRLADARRGLTETIAGADIVYAGGGSMRNLLAIWRAHGVDRLLTEAWRRGTVLAGLSAGAMCWFEGGITRSDGAPAPLAGLGLLCGSLSVHADGEPERLPAWLQAVGDGTLPGGWALDDGVGLLFEGERMVRAVSSRPGAGAVRVDAIAGELVRARLDVELLGGDTRSQTGTLDADVQELRRVQRLRARMSR